jgi:hypothetical protein
MDDQEGMPRSLGIIIAGAIAGALIFIGMVVLGVLLLQRP